MIIIICNNVKIMFHAKNAYWLEFNSGTNMISSTTPHPFHSHSLYEHKQTHKHTHTDTHTHTHIHINTNTHRQRHTLTKSLLGTLHRLTFISRRLTITTDPKIRFFFPKWGHGFHPKLDKPCPISWFSVINLTPKYDERT